MKKNLQIIEFEDKTTNAGKEFTRFKTSAGWMSCFDSLASDKLKKLMRKIVSVEVAESIANKDTPEEKIFHNIKKCYGEANEDSAEIPVVKPGVVNNPSVSNGKHTTMYVSYAKDVFKSLQESKIGSNNLIEDMRVSIDLIKQAKEAFE